MLKRLFLMALATMSLSMTTGCGRTAMPMAADLGTVRTASHQAVVYAAGKPRKLGFDMNRYMLKQAPMAHPQTLPPVQGLTPSKVDLRGQCSPVYDQEDLSSCTAFAVAKGMREYLQVAHHERQAPLSALYQYYETRKVRGSVDTDSGATITDAIKAATPGIAPDATWGYDTLQWDKQPPAAAYKAAGEFKLAKSTQLAGLEDIKKALAKGQPVVFGMKLYNYMQNVGPSGEMKMPEDGDIYVGGHAVCVVGYDNKKKVLIVRNSWGTAWGDKGYFYMPYAYVTPENVMDIWTAQ